MAWLNQVIQITLVNLRSLPQRIGTSLVVVIGIAGVVGVLEESGEVAAADHAGLIDHQDGAGVQLLAAAVEIG